MAFAPRVSEPTPFHAINVTPFIDVMLVLLIVMILSIPAVTHKVPVNLPTGEGARSDQPPHVLAIDSGGRLFWDGRAIADGELPSLLPAVRGEAGVLHMQTDPQARYSRFDEVLADVKRAGVERLGFIGHRPLD